MVLDNSSGPLINPQGLSKACAFFAFDKKKNAQPLQSL